METSSRGLQVRQNYIKSVKRAVNQRGYPRQQDLAEKLEISRDTISRFLNGRAVGYLNFIEISEALGFEWKEIAVLEPSQTDSSEQEPYKYSSLQASTDSQNSSLQVSSCQENTQTVWKESRSHLFSSFQTVIEKKTTDFIGRKYVFEAIHAFVHQQTCGYFIIQAKPGVGKSSILAEYVRRHGCISYFNVRSEGINRTEQFLESVCTQLIERYNLDYPFLPANATQDGGFLRQLLGKVANQSTNIPVIITVDALDEVDLNSQSFSANVLYLPHYLPDGVYFILTCRSDVSLPFNVQAPQQVFDLMSKDYEEAVFEDIQAYIYRAAKKESLKKWIQKQSLNEYDFVNHLAQKSEHNFMYLAYVLKDIEDGKYQDFSIEKLPKGLEGYYENHWYSMGMTKRPLPKPKIKIIYVLVKVGRPVSAQFISDVSDEERLIVQEVIEDWKQFLLEKYIEEQKCYSVYHTSFSDFLHRKDIVQSAEVMIEDIDTLIADHLWDGLFGDE